jgi:hypothetical protein
MMNFEAAQRRVTLLRSIKLCTTRSHLRYELKSAHSSFMPTRRWEREMSPMPGYELTEPWLTEEGLPKKGIWDVVYYAGGGHGRNGCKPMPKLRRALLQLVSARVVLVEWCFVLFLGVDADCGQVI